MCCSYMPSKGVAAIYIQCFTWFVTCLASRWCVTRMIGSVSQQRRQPALASLCQPVLGRSMLLMIITRSMLGLAIMRVCTLARARLVTKQV